MLVVCAVGDDHFKKCSSTDRTYRGYAFSISRGPWAHLRLHPYGCIEFFGMWFPASLVLHFRFSMGRLPSVVGPAQRANSVHLYRMSAAPQPNAFDVSECSRLTRLYSCGFCVCALSTILSLTYDSRSYYLVSPGLVRQLLVLQLVHRQEAAGMPLQQSWVGEYSDDLHHKPTPWQRKGRRPQRYPAAAAAADGPDFLPLR